MGHNRAGENRKNRLKRRKKETNRLKNKDPFEELLSSIHIKYSNGKTHYLITKDYFESIEWKLPKLMTFEQAVEFINNIGKNEKTN